MDRPPEHVVRNVRSRIPVPWDRIEPCASLALAGDGTAPRHGTRVRLVHDDERLYVRFACDDPDPWSTYGRRDDPLWREEAVEVFLAPGATPPSRYVEFQVSPAGVLYDARVDNPRGDRTDMTVDVAWDCPGVTWAAGERRRRGVAGWWAEIGVPLDGVLDALGVDRLPWVWRANFYRIERPRDGTPEEFSAWSPTGATPPDFHVPARFGVLRLARS